MAFAQLTYRKSLSDMETCLAAMGAKLYHTGFQGKVARSTLADANESRDWRIYADFAQFLIRITWPLCATDPIGVDLDQSLYALDSTTIDLCLSFYLWARFRKHKAAVKMHTLPDRHGSIRTLIRVTDGKAHDEVHFQHYVKSCRMSIPPEVKEPVLLHHLTRRSVGLFGAVRPNDGRFFYRRESDRFNAVSFWVFLKDLRRIRRHRGRRVVVITDNAKYHHARLHKRWRLGCQDDFALDYLPPYSPDLNPIERVWKLTRRLCLHSWYFPNLDEVVDAVEAKLEDSASASQFLRRLCAIT